MSEWSGSIPELLFTFVQESEPVDVDEGMTWFDLDSDTVWLFTDDSGSKTEFTVVDHAGLAGVGPADHHNPVTQSGPITVAGDQTVGLSIGDGLLDSSGTLVADLGNGLGIDGSGQIHVPTDAISQAMLGFATATQSDLSDHETDTTNPHNVTDDQTGAATALSNHASKSTIHHTPPTSTASARSGPYETITVDEQVTVSYDQSKWVTVPSHQALSSEIIGDEDNAAVRINSVEFLDGDEFTNGGQAWKADTSHDGYLYRPVDRVRVEYSSAIDGGSETCTIRLHCVRQTGHTHNI